MTFGTTPTDNLNTPMASVYVPGTANSDLTVLEGYGPINTDANSQKSAPVSMGIKDGNNASFGAKADTVATTDTGTFTYMQLFKRLLQKFPTIGTNTKASSLSVTIATDQGNIATSAADGAITSIGATTDTAATSDTGTFSYIALFKRLLQRFTLGQATMANSLPMVLASDQSNLPFNLKQVSGVAIAAGNPVISQDQIRAAIAAGKGFSATTGNLTATNATRAAAVFWPATNTKNILIYSVQIMDSNANSHIEDLRIVTTDPALGTAMTVANSQVGSATTSVVSASYSAGTITASGGTLWQVFTNSLSNPNEALLNGKCLSILPSTAGGLEIFMGNQSTGQIAATVSWIEL